ncbi:MAG: LemA family protein [Gammaproteobacteria bacterium]|nr:LemA family protein [Gammaproteobacteria bacterium]
MQSEERIRRMQADGILTATQAASLRESLNPQTTTDYTAAIDSRRHAHKRLVGWAIGLLGAVIVIGFFMLMTGSGGTPPTPQDVASTLNDPGGIGQMNKSFSSVLAIALFLIVPLLLWMWLHNSMVTKEESVFESWAQVESNLERRADLIPALVDTVSRYLRHESETLEAVTAERSNANLAAALEELLAAQKATADIVGGGNNIVEDESDLALLFAAQQRVGQQMHSFLAVAESYPELRSSDQFLELQAQLEGTENRINVARMRFNESVAAYNSAIRRLPASLVAGAGGFRRKAYFQADAESHDDPDLAFD